MKVDPAAPTTQTPVEPRHHDAAGADRGREQDPGRPASGPPAAGVRIGTLEGYDLVHPGKQTVPFTFKTEAKGAYVTKLVAINNAFWLTALGPDGESVGLEPFTMAERLVEAGHLGRFIKPEAAVDPPAGGVASRPARAAPAARAACSAAGCAWPDRCRAGASPDPC